MSPARPAVPFEHAYEVRVRYGDTDQMGFAYHANHLYWFEIARTEWLRARGRSYKELEAEGLSLPVIEARCRYLAPARYDDRLRLVTRIGELARAAVRFDYRIENAADGRLLAEGSTRHCVLGPAGRPVRIEGALRAVLEG